MNEREMKIYAKLLAPFLLAFLGAQALAIEPLDEGYSLVSPDVSGDIAKGLGPGVSAYMEAREQRLKIMFPHARIVRSGNQIEISIEPIIFERASLSLAVGESDKVLSVARLLNEYNHCVFSIIPYVSKAELKSKVSLEEGRGVLIEGLLVKNGVSGGRVVKPSINCKRKGLEREDGELGGVEICIEQGQ